MTLNKDFYKNIMENLPEGMAVCDLERNIIDVNKNFEKLTGGLKKNLLGKNISIFIKNTGTGCDNCSQETILIENEFQKTEGSKPKLYYIGELIDKNNSLIRVRINFSITKDNQVIYLITPLEDIAFLNRAHNDFISTVSHELRTPLTSIKGFADTLFSSGDKLSNEQQKRFLSIIKSQVDRLTRLVEDLLTVSKFESKKDKLIYKAIELPKFFENIIYVIQPKAREHLIEVKIMPNLPPVWADSDKLEQIITNLIDNAIKYSAAGTKVIIEAKFLCENTDFMQINIKDQGVGIPEEYMLKIFTKFSRIDNPLTRQAEGTGLGLYITKSLVENMGGNISVTSGNDGSTFSLMLPVATYEKPTQKKF